MSLTVDQLIKKLQKVKNKKLIVFWADHDHGDFETNNMVNHVLYVNQDEASDRQRSDECFDQQPEEYIVLRP